jgi:hypothetical protein
MVGKSVLHLTLHRQYFDEIAVGTKTTEYRATTPYWAARLEGRAYDVIIFKNGYGSKVPEMWVKFLGVRKYGKGRSGHYAIRLGTILKIKRWRRPKA